MAEISQNILADNNLGKAWMSGAVKQNGDAEVFSAVLDGHRKTSKVAEKEVETSQEQKEGAELEVTEEVVLEVTEEVVLEEARLVDGTIISLLPQIQLNQPELIALKEGAQDSGELLIHANVLDGIQVNNFGNNIVSNKVDIVNVNKLDNFELIGSEVSGDGVGLELVAIVDEMPADDESTKLVQDNVKFSVIRAESKGGKLVINEQKVALPNTQPKQSDSPLEVNAEKEKDVALMEISERSSNNGEQEFSQAEPTIEMAENIAENGAIIAPNISSLNKEKARSEQVDVAKIEDSSTIANANETSDNGQQFTGMAEQSKPQEFATKFKEQQNQDFQVKTDIEVDEIPESKEMSPSVMNDVKSADYRPSEMSGVNVVEQQDASTKSLRENIRDQVMIKISEITNQDNKDKTLTIQLNPHDLGTVELKLVYNANIKEIELNASNKEAYAALKEHEAVLKAELEKITGSEDASLSFNLSDGNQSGQEQPKPNFRYQSLELDRMVEEKSVASYYSGNMGQTHTEERLNLVV